MPLSSVLGAQSLVKPGVCTSSTRPASPFEGQTIYETDTDRLATWDGSAWISYVRQTAGKVLQVVSTTKTDTFTTTSNSFTDITGLSVSITPSSASNKVLVSYIVNGSGLAATNAGFINLVRDSTTIAIGDSSGSRTRTTSYLIEGASASMTTSGATHLDSPATTSSVTYKLQTRTNATSSGAVTNYINRTPSDTDSQQFGRTVSTITAMEISG